jgi:LysM repeat protein
MAAQRKTPLSLTVILGLLVLSAATAGVGVVVGIQSRDSTIEALSYQQREAYKATEALGEENATLKAQIATQEQKIKELTQSLDNTYTAVEVGGVVDFPVLRGMARPGDTVSSFAKREGTTVDILRALNPWLKDSQTTLQNRQTLWIPKP